MATNSNIGGFLDMIIWISLVNLGEIWTYLLYIYCNLMTYKWNILKYVVKIVKSIKSFVFIRTILWNEILPTLTLLVTYKPNTLPWLWCHYKVVDRDRRNIVNSSTRIKIIR